MNQARGECKTPGGKLVGVSLFIDDDGQVVRGQLDGDFFVEGDDIECKALIRQIEQLLTRRIRSEKYEYTIAMAMDGHPDVRLIGTDAAAIACAWNRAWRSYNGSGSDDTVPVVHKPSHSRSISDAEREEYLKRWRAQDWLIVRDHPRSPQDQMDTDVQWAKEVAAGVRPATLRMWEWAGEAVAIGRFQSVDNEVNAEVARRYGFEVVRRCTGGGAMLVRPGSVITYSLTVPQSFVAGLSMETSYRLCDFWALDALRELGVDVGFSGLNDIATSQGKVGGAAQRRFVPIGEGPGAVLHHTTIAYGMDADIMAKVLKTSSEKMSDKAVKSAKKRIDPLNRYIEDSREDVVNHMLDVARRVTM